MPVHFWARHHYINLLEKQAEFYEFQNAENCLVASGAAEHAEKVAAAGSAIAFCRLEIRGTAKSQSMVDL